MAANGYIASIAVALFVARGKQYRVRDRGQPDCRRMRGRDH